MAQLHAIILTKNEERHIGRCLTSIADICTSILIVDSGSIDRTAEIAQHFGAEVVINPWVNYATQFNFGIEHCRAKSGWLLRIDADEVLEDESAQQMTALLEQTSPEHHGIAIQRRIFFMGRRIRHGGIEPSWQLRIWRAASGRCEDRWMDEHITVNGVVVRSDIIIEDRNENSLGWWTMKHDGYASREAIDILISQGSLPGNHVRIAAGSRQAKLKRYLKNRIYNRMPGAIRSLMYFMLRYVFLLGFLDGRSGYYFHVLQGFWYRTLVDAKLHEIIATSANRDMTLTDAIKDRTGIDLRAAAPVSAYLRYRKEGAS